MVEDIKRQLTVVYQSVEMGLENDESLNKAFDILFEETLKNGDKYEDLTANDN